MNSFLRRPRGRTVVLAVMLPILIYKLGIASARELQPGVRDSQLNTPWSVSPDGQLEFNIFGRQVTLPPCARCQSYIEFYITSFTAKPLFFETDLGKAIRHPAALSSALKTADRVTIVVATPPGGLLLDRFARPEFHRLTLTFYKKAISQADCQRNSGPLAWPICNYLLSKLAETANIDASGFVVVKDPLYSVRGDTMFIPVNSKLRTSIGVPPFIMCAAWNSICQNGDNILEGSSFYMNGNLAIGFSFDREKVPESEWIGLFEKAQSVVEAVTR